MAVLQPLLAFATLEAEALPAWVAFMVVVATSWGFNFRDFFKPVAKDDEKKLRNIKDTMGAVLSYVKSEDKKDASKRKMPDAARVLKLLWDDTHEVRTTHWGFAPELDVNSDTEALFKKIFGQELRKVIDLTKLARANRLQGTDQEIPESEHLAGKSDADKQKELAAHESGEKLQKQITFAKEVKDNMGVEYLDLALLKEAEDLAREVYSDQHKNIKALLKLVRPAVPSVAMAIFINVVNAILRSKFHQIGIWASAAESASHGKLDEAYSTLFHIWVGHMVIKCFEFLDATFTAAAMREFGRHVRSGVLSSMIRQDFEYFEKTPPGVLQDRLNRDADELGENMVQFPKRMAARATWVGANLATVYAQTPFDLFIVAIIPVIFMICFQYYMFRRFRRAEKRERKVVEEAIASTSEVLREIKTVRQFAMEPSESANYARGELSRSSMVGQSHVTRSMMEKAAWMVFDTFLALVMYLGLPYVQSGQMSVSGLVDMWVKLNFHICFCFREIVEELPRMSKLFHPLGRICDLLQAQPVIEPPEDPAYQDTSSASELQALLAKCEVKRDDMGKRKVWTVLAKSLGASDSEEVPKVGAQLVSVRTSDYKYFPVADMAELDLQKMAYPVRAIFSRKLRPARFNGHIEFRDVHFAYPTDRRKRVLQGLNFTVEPGQKVALVGATGCGKSSCMGLLQRLFDPMSGEILIDGRPLQDYDIHFLRSRIVIVDQFTVLFNTTIRDNISYGVKVSEEEIVQACKDAKAWDFISEKPDKLLTVLEPGGSNLSGGEKQRLAIARAMVRKPDVILLDEATSALDNENEAKVQEALDKLARAGSALVIAHRLSTIRDSDKIVVVDKGMVVEAGAHDELLSGGGQVLPAPEARTKGSKDLLGPPDLARGRSDEISSMLDAPPPQPTLNRATTAAAVQVKPQEKPKASYKRLWEAATGAPDTMSLSQLQKKVGAMETELGGLKAKMLDMQQQKDALVSSNESLRLRRSNTPPSSGEKSTVGMPTLERTTSASAVIY